MGKKIDIDEVAMTLVRLDVAEEQRTAVLANLQQIINELEAEKAEQPPKPKKTFGIIVSDPEGILEVGQLTGWIVKHDEETNPGMLPIKVAEAARDFNTTRKGRRCPVSTVGEALENVPSRIFREYGLSVSTKEPVCVVPVLSTLLPVVTTTLGIQ